MEDVVQFLKQHIQHDIRCLARNTGNNGDEAVQIIHLVLVSVVNKLQELNDNGTFTNGPFPQLHKILIFARRTKYIATARKREFKLVNLQSLAPTSFRGMKI